MNEHSHIDPFLLRKLGKSKRAAGGAELRFNCPECINRRHHRGIPDREFKLQVNFTEGVFYCHRCYWSGSLEQLMDPVAVERSKIVTWRDKFIEKILGGSVNEPPPDLPDDWMIAPRNTQWDGTYQYAWLCNRLSSIPSLEIDQLIDNGIVRQGQGSKYCTRIFLLDIYHDVIRYWGARSILDSVEPKYISPYGISRYKVLFNQEYLERTRPPQIIICEGVISSIVAGRDSLGTWGRIVTDGQLKLLHQLNARRYYIASESDPDARADTSALAKALHKLGHEVFTCYLPDGEDPASLGRDKFRSMLDYAEQYTWRSHILRRISYGR